MKYLDKPERDELRKMLDSGGFTTQLLDTIDVIQQERDAAYVVLAKICELMAIEKRGTSYEYQYKQEADRMRKLANK